MTTALSATVVPEITVTYVVLSEIPTGDQYLG